jgi:hypothetical protein
MATIIAATASSTPSAVPSRNGEKGVQELKIPFTRALTVLLRKEIPLAQRQADDDIRDIENGGVTVSQPVNEGYFHRLRRRVAERPELAKNIVVFYQDENDKLHEIGLSLEDQVRWPVGFCSELWEEESEIEAARRKNAKQK